MPAAAILEVTVTEKKYLKSFIEHEYNLKIIDTPSCKLLSELIFTRKKITISYSTIRRFFDIIPNNHHSPSMYTLNSLVKSIGFNDWSDFKIHQEKYNVNSVNQNIQIYFNLPGDSNNLIFETVKNLSLEHWNGAYQLQSIILLAIEKNDFKLLNKILTITYDLEKNIVYESLVMAFQSFYFQSTRNNRKVIDFVKNNIGHSTLLQKCLLQAYVDERYLNDFFGEWLEVKYDKELDDLFLFKSLLLCEKAFINQDIDLALSYFEQCQFSLKKNRNIHAILLARISAWEMILLDTEKHLYKFYNSIEKLFDKADFLVIFSRLIWTYKSQYNSIKILDDINLNDFPIVKDFFQKGRYNVLLITLAINSYLKKDFIKSQQLFLLFEPNTLGYDIVNLDFYIKWADILKH